MTRIHIPISADGDRSKRRFVKVPTNRPILFLAGPIRNAPPWQCEAIRIARKQKWEGLVVSPARGIEGDLTSLVEPDKPEYEAFHRQRAWEQYYMYNAARIGCVMFWLCKEAPVKIYPDKVYAHITTLELGKWIERKKLIPDETRLVIGTDGEFPEWSTIEFEIESELPGFVIERSLEDTVARALAEAES